MKKSIILFLDTSERETIKVSISADGVKLNTNEITQNTKAQNTLGVIEEILKNNKLFLSDLTEIKINPGPGSFVGLRVGITIANTLAFLLNIPVNEQKPPVLPVYE